MTREIKMDNDKRTALIALTICGAIILGIYLTTDKPPKQQPKAKVVKIPESFINELYATGFLYRIEPQNNQAYIDNSKWLFMTIDAKRTLTIALANYCSQKSNGENSIMLLNHLSGKLLAHYSQEYGFSVD